MKTAKEVLGVVTATLLLMTGFLFGQQWSGASNTTGAIYRTGSVGIGNGVTNPAGLLDVSGVFYTAPAVITIRGLTDSPEGGEIQFGGATGTPGWPSFGLDNYEGNMRFTSGTATRFFVSNDGKFGIGFAPWNSVPQAQIHINGAAPFRITNGFAATDKGKDFSVDVAAGTGLANLVVGAKINSGGNGYDFTGSRGAARIRLHDGLLEFYTSNSTTGQEGTGVAGLMTPKMVINNLGNIGIGTSTPDANYKLSVNGKVRAKEVVVESTWSDFVFADDYQLKPLHEVERYIKTNKHLPEIPSEREVTKNGVKVGEMQAKLLQKIEELTLYVIELKKENERLQQRLDHLEARRD